MEEYPYYVQLLQKLAEEEMRLHTENQKRIRAGVQCLIWIPMIFLGLLFLTEGVKAIFLVLWIVSLFVISSYLIYIEYIDFQSQQRLHLYQNDETSKDSMLIGTDMEEFEEIVTELLRQIDAKKAVRHERMLRMVNHQKEKLPDTEQNEVHHE